MVKKHPNLLTTKFNKFDATGRQTPSMIGIGMGFKGGYQPLG